MVPNLRGAVIGRPGLMKTPAIAEPLKPLKGMEIEAESSFNEAQTEHAAEEMVREASRKVGERQIHSAIKEDSDGRTVALTIARSLVAEEEIQPVRRRYLLNDPTVEKLGEILNENPNGVMVFRDELIGLLKSARTKRGGTRRRAVVFPGIMGMVLEDTPRPHWSWDAGH